MAAYALSIDLWTLASSVLITLRNSVEGFAIALLASLGAAYLYFSRPGLRPMVYALNTMLQSVSVLAWAIVLTMAFGVLSPIPPVLVTAAACLPVIMSSAVEAVRAVDERLMDVMKMLGASKPQAFLNAVLPASVPSLAAASRSGLGLALRISVVAEAFGSSGGVGYMMVRAYSLVVPEGVMAWALILVALMLAMDLLVMRRVVEVAEAWRLS